MSVINKFITRTAATEDDTVDHIGTETPGSGVATPQPDLQDKRLPGIMSYFGQVRQDSVPCLEHSSVSSPSCGSSLLTEQLAQPQKPLLPSVKSQHFDAGQAPRAGAPAMPDLKHLLISHARPSAELSTAHVGAGHLVSYPTPPASHPSSSHCSDDAKMHEQTGASVDCSGSLSARRDSTLTCTRDSSSRSIVHLPPEGLSQAVKISNAALQGVSSSVDSPTSADNHSLASQTRPQPPGKWFSFDGLKELTRGVIFKSGQSTPTRALSTAQPSQSEGTQSSGRNSHDDGTASGTQTPRGTAGAQAPASKGKLTIKIAEARGLRKCRDPYVVAVFQRSELISGGPRPGENEEPLNAATSAMGGIPIQRQGSDSGRTPMAIPMRSRQSSNTSITDYNTFRNRPRRQSFTNPTWDAEAVL
jgi:protein-serine/threonine kinase